MTKIEIPADLIRERLGDGDLWITAGWGEWDGDGPTCLHGAIRSCHPQPGDAYLIEQIGAKFGFGTSFNDANDWATIDGWLGSSPEITDEMCEATFGPQWVEVVGFVRRESAMTVPEIEALGAAWVAGRGAALGAALGAAGRVAGRDATLGAVREAVREAARGVVWATPWDVARGAALGAACALSARDLIGTGSYTQQHYDLLTGPWAAVIGPVHPDDGEAA